MSGFQAQVLEMQAGAVEGDFTSSNPRYSTIDGPGGLIAGAQGAVVGRWGWLSFEVADLDGSPAIVNSFGAGNPAGFIGRQGAPGVIWQYLASASLNIPQGLPVPLYDAGDFWVLNRGSTQALWGSYVLVNYYDGGTSFNNTGDVTQGGTSTASSIAAETFSITGSISGNILKVTAVGSGSIYPGATISGLGVASGTKIVMPLYETTDGIGMYAVSIPEQSVAAGTSISGTYGLLTIGGTVTGSFGTNYLLSGTGVAPGSTFIMEQISGIPGGAGTYVVNNNTVVSSTEIDAALNTIVPWYAWSSGLPGELVKISNRQPNWT